MTYICLDCGHTFSEPAHYTERHGLSQPPYEEFSGCPACGGAFDEAIFCEGCGELIPKSEAVMVDGEYFCETCGGEDGM